MILLPVLGDPRIIKMSRWIFTMDLRRNQKAKNGYIDTRVYELTDDIQYCCSKNA